jgi:hypothetical protein
MIVAAQFNRGSPDSKAIAAIILENTRTPAGTIR